MAVDFAGGILSEIMDELHPMGRMVKMKGVVNTALFALSDDAMYPNDWKTQIFFIFSEMYREFNWKCRAEYQQGSCHRPCVESTLTRGWKI